MLMPKGKTRKPIYGYIIIYNGGISVIVFKYYISNLMVYFDDIGILKEVDTIYVVYSITDNSTTFMKIKKKMIRNYSLY